MNKIASKLQSHPIIIVVMFFISLLGGIIGIALGWEDFYNDVLSKSMQIPIWVILLLILSAFIIYVFKPEKEKIPKSDEEFKLVEGESFGVQQVVLDGKKFINCEFNGTELLFNGKSGFTMGHNTLTRIRFTMTENAAQTAIVLTGMRKDPAFAPIVDSILDDIKSGGLPEAPAVNENNA